MSEMSKNNIDVHVITSKKAEKLDDKYMHVYNEIEEWDKSRSKENNQKIKRDWAKYSKYSVSKWWI